MKHFFYIIMVFQYMSLKKKIQNIELKILYIQRDEVDMLTF
jgi:hypothetical protein